jgi:hypothetical protein
MGGSLEIILDGMRLVCESVKIQIHGSSLYVFGATWMTASSALMIV